MLEYIEYIETRPIYSIGLYRMYVYVRTSTTILQYIYNTITYIRITYSIYPYYIYYNI